MVPAPRTSISCATFSGMLWSSCCMVSRSLMTSFRLACSLQAGAGGSITLLLTDSLMFTATCGHKNVETNESCQQVLQRSMAAGPREAAFCWMALRRFTGNCAPPRPHPHAFDEASPSSRAQGLTRAQSRPYVQLPSGLCSKDDSCYISSIHTGSWQLPAER